MSENVQIDQSFDKFFIETYPRIKAFAQRILMREEEAEDAVHDVYLKLLGMPEMWDADTETANKYLFTMTRNHIFNMIKRKSIERKYQETLFNNGKIIEEFGLEDNLYAKELEILSKYTIEQMPDRRREVFKMSRFEGKSTKEISQALGLSIRTVERHIYLALTELKKILLFIVLFPFFIE